MRRTKGVIYGLPSFHGDKAARVVLCVVATALAIAALPLVFLLTLCECLTETCRAYWDFLRDMWDVNLGD